jgi:UDP-N-acetylmuramate--alanine ligase
VRAASLVIITPAVPSTFRVELFYGANTMKRAEVLGIITKDTFVLLSRERTEKTTSSILGHILYESGADASFIGGIVENYNSNLVGKRYCWSDEFDRSFAF